jgi:hypothetical protein
LAQVAAPTIVVSLLASTASSVATEVFAVLWGLALIGALGLRLFISADGGDADAAVVAACYWAVLGLATCSPLDSFIAMAIGFILWTSARPGHEWLPWPTIYAKFSSTDNRPLAWVAAAPLWSVPAAAGASTVILTLLLGSGESLVLFIVLVLLALALLALSSAGEPVPATRALGRLAIVLACGAWAAASPWRIVLLGLCVVIALLSWRSATNAVRYAHQANPRRVGE